MRGTLNLAFGLVLTISSLQGFASSELVFKQNIGMAHGRSDAEGAYCNLRVSNAEDAEPELVYSYGDYKGGEQVKISVSASEFSWSKRKKRLHKRIVVKDRRLNLDVFVDDEMQAEKVVVSVRGGEQTSVCYLQPYLDKKQHEYLFFDQNWETYRGIDEASGEGCNADFEAEDRKSVKIDFYDRLKKSRSSVTVAKESFALEQMDFITSFRDGFKIDETSVIMSATDLYELSSVTIKDRSLLFGDRIRAECHF